MLIAFFNKLATRIYNGVRYTLITTPTLGVNNM